MNMVAQGTDLKGINSAVLEYFSPGDRVQAIVGLPRSLSYGELTAVASHLSQSGLELISLEEGETAEWPSAIRLTFTRPYKSSGYAQFLLAGLILAALATVTISGIVGWKIGGVVDKIGKNIVPLAIITALAIVAITQIKTKEKRRV